MKLHASASVDLDDMDEEFTAGEVSSQAILLASIWMNGVPVAVAVAVAVKINRTLALVSGQPIITTSEGSTGISDGKKISVMFVEEM